jgi:hypothetical protein
LGEDGIIGVAGSDTIAIQKDAATGGNQYLSTQQGRVEERTFDRVFGPEASQNEVYLWTCKPLICDAIAMGKSATIFVYGATGAGKTHTMFGPGDEPVRRGLIFRAIGEVFERLRELGGSSSGSFEVRLSFLEIYNEVVRDLLHPQPQDGSACRVLEDARNGVVKVSNLLEVGVHDEEDAMKYLHMGMHARTVEATAANHQSSRAHAVFTLQVEHVRDQAISARRASEIRTLHSKICLIDLAGSERAAITQNSGTALKDGARINQSLLALANCIDALTQQRGQGVGNNGISRKKPPYRDSKLTLMLKSSLTSDGLVAMIANVHPGRTHFEDSNNTLEYAKRASVVRTARRRPSVITMPQAPGPRSMSASLSGLEAGVAAAGEKGLLSREAVRGRRGESAEITTASSPEDCLSEISLSLGAAESEASPMESGAASHDTDPEFGRTTPDSAADGNAVADETPQAAPLVGDVTSLSLETTDPDLASRIVATLRAEKALLARRLADVMQERDSLLDDRRELEKANEGLRAVNAEKDEQLAYLLARCQGAAA